MDDLGRAGRTLVRVAGFVTGLLAAFGVALAIFDYAHQGENTTGLQLLIGGLLPFATVVLMSFWFRSRAVPRSRVLSFWLSILLGFVAGIGILFLLG